MTQGYFDDAMTDEAQVERQQSTGRPMIKQPDGSVRAYTRASQLGDYLTDQEFLEAWHMRNLAVALGRRRDLADLAAVEPYTTGFAEPPQHIKSASAKALDGYIARALDSVVIDERADRGTVVHHVTEMNYDGFIPISVIGEKAAFDEFIRINKIQRLGSEIFVVNDDLQVAGTFDHLWYVPALESVVIGDTKNGRNQNNLGFSIQFANYANSRVYEVQTGNRMTLEEYIESRFGLHHPINREVAILLSVKERQAKPSDVNIVWGYEMAKLAAAVRDARGNGAGKVLQSKLVKAVKGKAAIDLARKAIGDRIAATDNAAELGVIWRTHKDIWTDELTTRASARKLQLGATS
jgi:hypothetical protein